ncbi:MAG TPA: hypothetical protein VF008_25770 [Niastella sp.]
MKKKCISLWVLCLPLLLKAQITINVVQPPAGMISKDQLWNLVLTNNSNTASEVTILMNLKDAVTGQSVLSAGTRSVLLGKGVKMLAIQDIQPVQYNYGAQNLAGNFLPLGSYIACYTVSRYSHELMETLATECTRIHITPLSAPLLNTPANKAVLQTPAPQLTWLPPTPINMFDNLSYDVRVTEVMEGQSPSEAIIFNTPLYTAGRVKVPYENYSPAYSKLQPGKMYAWQVTARNGDNYAAATEVWTFSLAADSAKKEPVYTTYISLNNNSNQSGVHFITGNTLYVKYYSFDKEHESVMRLYGADKKIVQEIKQTILYGDNFLHFNLNRQYHSGQVYTIEITDLQNNKHTASFSKSNQTN